MRSIEARIALISQAIDEVASARNGMAKENTTAEECQTSKGYPTADTDARLAAIWAMIAELDSALTTRLPAYAPDALSTCAPRTRPDLRASDDGQHPQEIAGRPVG